jgi:hypothetical protein
VLVRAAGQFIRLKKLGGVVNRSAGGRRTQAGMSTTPPRAVTRAACKAAEQVVTEINPMIGWLKFVADAKDLGFYVAEDAEAFASFRTTFLRQIVNAANHEFEISERTLRSLQAS